MFALVIVLAWLLALTPLILISGENRKWGVSDYIFAFGDEVVNDAAAFMIQMPIFVLCAELCPVYVCNDITLLCSALSFSSPLYPSSILALSLSSPKLCYVYITGIHSLEEWRALSSH